MLKIGESLICFKPDDYFIIIKNKPNSRPIPHNKIAKVLFFVYREGLIRTFQKIKSKNLQNEIESKYTVILAQYSFQKSCATLVGLGLQCGLNIPYLSFHKDLTVVVKDEFLAETIHKIKAVISKEANVRSVLSDYNPFSGNAPVIKLSALLNKTWVADEVSIKGDFSDLITSDEQSLPGNYNLYLIGAGDYARTYILANIKSLNRSYVIDHNYNIAQVIAKRYGFNAFGIHYHSLSDRIQTEKKPVFIIAGYHSTHTPIALDILEKNPSAYIFIEKPPVTTEDQLKSLAKVYDPGQIFIGYNRRHIPWVKQIKQRLSAHASPLFIQMNIKEVKINTNHWYHWPNQGTRITGNLCHWIDLAIYWVASGPQSLGLMKSGSGDELVLSIRFEDGSLVSIFSTEAGNSLRGVQEKIEIRFDETTIFLDDFLKMIIFENGKKIVKRKIRRDKGHDRMYQYFQDAVMKGKADKYSKRDLILSSIVYLKASKMFIKNIPHLDLDYSGYLD